LAAADPDLPNSGVQRSQRATPGANAGLRHHCAGCARPRRLRVRTDLDHHAQTGILRGIARDVRALSLRATHQRTASPSASFAREDDTRAAVRTGVRPVRTDGNRCAAGGSDVRGVLRVARKFRSCICRRYSALRAGDVAASIARTTMTRATNFQGGSMAARKKAAKRGAKKSAKRGKKAAKRGKKK
jgi:hypothetical protein